MAKYLDDMTTQEVFEHCLNNTLKAVRDPDFVEAKEINSGWEHTVGNRKFTYICSLKEESVDVN